MSQWQSQTNASLFYAQRLLSMYKAGDDTAIQQDQHALLTGAWLCLKESWCSWLNELSAYMSLDRTEAYQVSDLQLLLQTDLPEGQLLLGLIDDPESWLTALLQRTMKPTERLKPVVKSSEMSTGLISLVATDEIAEDQLIGRVLSEYKEYIESVRVRHIEW